MEIWKGKFGPLLIAEIGGNHEGDFEYAKKLTKLAIESKVDYIKFQLYTGDTLVNPVQNPIRNKHFKKFELSRDQYLELADMCNQSDSKFMASVWNGQYIEWIDEASIIYKIGSGDLTAHNVIASFVETGKPILLSSGLSFAADVEETIQFIYNLDSSYEKENKLALLQCTSMYPIPNNEAHLNVMSSFKEMFQIPIGYSDHTEGAYALEVAVAMGAEILEFHFTDDRTDKVFRDHKVSLTKSEVHELIDKIKIIDDLKGSSKKVPLAIEGEHVTTFRRGLYFSRDMKQGEVIQKEDLVTLRPNNGMDAREYYNLIGKKMQHDCKKYEVIKTENIS